MIRRYGLPGLATAMLLVLVLSPSWGRSTFNPEEEANSSPATVALLKQINTAPEQTLKGTMALPEAVVSKIMAHRAGGKTFTSLLQVRSITKMAPQDMERLLLPYMDQENQRAFEAQRKPVPEPASPGKAGGKLQHNTPANGQEKATGATEGAGGTVTPTGTGPITAVRPGFYGKLPGYEGLDKIDPLKRTEFLETVNREFCTCGCKNETVAFCLVNDPTCPVVKSRAKKIYDDIMTKPAH